MPASVILASTSRYRAELLQRLGIKFEQIAPDCDENPLEGETALALVTRLSALKALSVAQLHPQSLVIGSDQVACCEQKIIGKPGSHDEAVKQLGALSGKAVEFHTGLCVVNLQSKRRLTRAVTTRVSFKTLNNDQIERYLAKDKPYDCAASFRSEGYGSTIVDSMQSDDPTAIIGLPVITVADYLDQLGVNLP